MQELVTPIGTTYLGCDPGDVYTLGGLTINNNPYFWYGDPPNYTDWFLYVGNVFPYSYGLSTKHSESGIYNTSGTKVANTLYDFRFKSGTTNARHRTYLYYCTNTANRQYFAYPRVDVCDGTEPSISDLINGLDADPSFQSTVQDDNRGDPMSIQKREVRISHINSDSINTGLVAHWKLNGTGYDSTDNHYNGNVSGTAPSVIDDTTSMDFTSDYIVLPNDVGYTSQFSSFCWFKHDGAPTGGYHIIWGGQEMEISIPAAGALRTGVLTSAGRFCTNSGSGLTDGNWHHVGFTFNGTQRVNYIDGQHVGTTAGITGNLTYTFANRTMGRYGASTSYYLNGKLRDARIYDIVLDATEVELLYETTKTYQPELKQSEYGVFTKGKIVGV